ncbi:hypothetical protein OAU50_08455 [Planctomycetota bacterium]|nr:hypothetical protein [Planctomycetota bacterium]
MTYTKKKFVAALRDQCKETYDVVALSRWAFAEYLSNSNKLETGLYDFIFVIVCMEEGPEFELTKDELLAEAERLL